MRNGLYMFRHGKRLSQAEISAKIGCHRATYAAIESGTRNGGAMFWNALQNAFGLTDAELAALQTV